MKLVDKIIFIDIDSVKKTKQLNAKAVFIRNDELCYKVTDENTISYDALNYLELTRLQCQIVRDNIVEVIRFADTGKLV